MRIRTADEAFRWMVHHNMDHIVSFHKTMQAMLKEKLQDPKYRDDPFVRHTLEIYDDMNAANTLLIALGFLEEVLFQLRDRCGVATEDRGGIDRYKELLLKEKLRLDLGTMPCWQVVKDAYTIRDCLLHAHGRVSLMKSPEKVLDCVRRHPDGLKQNHDRLSVNSVFLLESVDAIRDLQERMVDAAEALHPLQQASPQAEQDE